MENLKDDKFALIENEIENVKKKKLENLDLVIEKGLVLENIEKKSKALENGVLFL